MESLIESSEARGRILARLPDIPEILCPLGKCAGRVLRADLIADRDFPPYDRAMMDGYAVRAAEAADGALLSVGGSVFAGHPPPAGGPLPGSCFEIMTGAMMPRGADCVIPIEWTEKGEDGGIRITGAPPAQPGGFVHPKGSDLRKGDAVLRSGRLLGSREIAVAASCGCASLAVSKLPAILIASTGDELVGVRDKPLPHQIRRSNDQMIETALARKGLNAEVHEPLPDDFNACREIIAERAAENDFIVFTGGISKGAKDILAKVLDDLGFARAFHGVAQRPGRPMGYWSTGECGIFALPGNPLSVLTCLHHYVIPAVFAAMGAVAGGAEPVVRLTETFKKPKNLTFFLPVSLADGNTARARPPRNSGDMIRILESDGYIQVPRGTETADAGQAYGFHPWV